MREIKFRAWDTKVFRMRGWEEVSSFPFGMPAHTDWMWFMQYTGLKDKNGKEIYEGDITQFGEVEWVCDELKSEDIGWHIKDHWRPESRWASMFGYNEPFEVIGNIYENPELLKEV